ACLATLHWRFGNACYGERNFLTQFLCAEPIALGIHPNMDASGKFATAHGAFANTRSDVVPRRPSRNPSGPSVVLTIKSARISLAVCRMVSGGLPPFAMPLQIQWVSSGNFTAGISAAGPT